jgi:TonB-linked SusC/RagA family outer membrane protein
MKKSVFLVWLLLSTGWVGAQTGFVTGSVVSTDNGKPVVGALVKAKGSIISTETDAEGAFRMYVPDETTILIVSGRGMVMQEVAISTFMSVLMQAETSSRDEEAVMVWGARRDERTLGYAVQTVDAKLLTQAANPVLPHALQGKTSGVSIHPSSGMPGASSLMTIRGARSFLDNNAPLYVVDGMPVASNADILTINGVSGVDYANRALDLDPNDIDRVHILKGHAATALYGVRASNGVILITTRHGSALAKADRPRITVASNVSWEVTSRRPQLQSTYAQGSMGSYEPMSSQSWGPEIAQLPDDPVYGGQTVNAYTLSDGQRGGQYYVPQRANAGLDPWVTPQTYNHMRSYMETGATWNNYVHVAQTLERSTYAFSLGSVKQSGVIPTTGMNRYNLKASDEVRWNSHLKAGFTANCVATSVRKMPSANEGVMATLYGAPPSYDAEGIPSSYANAPGRINSYRAGSFPPPYWAPDHTDFTEQTDRFYGNAYVEYATSRRGNQRLEVKYQPGMDVYTTTCQDLWGYGMKGSDSNGQVEYYSQTHRTVHSLLTAFYEWAINEKLELNVLSGHEIIHGHRRHLYAYGSDYQFAGWEHLNNTIAKENMQYDTQELTAGLGGEVTLAYDRLLYAGIAARYDKVSAMPRGARSFLSPAVSLGFILTELDFMKQYPAVDCAKLRVSFAQAGQVGDGDYAYRETYYSIPVYGGGVYAFTPLTYPIGGTTAYTPYEGIYDSRLAPRKTQSYEAGLDAGFLHDAIVLNYTFARQDTKDQLFDLPLAGSTGSSHMLTNAGRMYVNSHEVTLGIRPVRTKEIDWQVAFNWTSIRSQVVELAPDVEYLFIGGFSSPQVGAAVGNTYPVIYGTGYKRDTQGHILVDKDGMPQVGETKVIGRVSPDFILGINTTLQAGRFTLSAVVDWKAGGQMYSGTNGLLGYYGVGKETEGRDGSFVVNGYTENGSANEVAISGAAQWQSYYERISEIEEASVYNNSFIKLRELALSYPIYASKRLTAVANLFARNLLLWTEYPNFDPESSQGNTNMTGAFERFSLPQTSSYGLGLTLTF